MANLRKKQASLQELSAKTAENCPFHPQINKKSRELAQKPTKPSHTSFSFNKCPQKPRKTAEESCTFQPQIVKNPKYRVEGEFLERMQAKLKEKQRKLVENSEKHLLFQPKINKISEFLAKEDEIRAELSVSERLFLNVTTSSRNSLKKLSFCVAWL